MECKYPCLSVYSCTMYELIDTLWNVNTNWICLTLPPFVRINRYIMECKYEIDPAYSTAFCELIDTLWNVNSKVFDEQVGQNMN